MQNELDVKWVGLGKQLNVSPEKRVNEKDPVKEGMVHIQENDKSFIMRGYESAPPAGITIDANLAVYFIKKFHDKLNSEPFLNFLKKGFSTSSITEIENAEITKWLKNLLIFSRAISVDKNILMKVLSQPGCEGVRYYLGLKQNDAFDPSVGETLKNPKQVMVLVLVGIDKDGKDLNYSFDPEIRSSVQSGVYDVTNTSVTGEYNYPPPPNNFTKENSENCYVLGEIAWGTFYDKLFE